MQLRMQGGRTHIHYWCERKLAQPLWKSVWRFPKKLKPEFPYDPAVPLLKYTWKSVSSHAYNSSIHNSQTMESA
jgi:hypothetical protein